VKSQGDKIETPSYIRDNNLKIDYAFYITNQIAKPVAQVFGLVVEQLPGVKKEDLERIKHSSKPVEAREALADSLLFGKILDEIAKKKKAETVLKKQQDEKTARSNFINRMF
jgi:DNA polymerase elongation subunit (family B)